MKNDLINNFKNNIGTEKLFEIFSKESIKIFIVGGCIRNALLNIKVKDIDFAVACSPEKTIEIILKNKLNYNDFAIKYGSIQVIINKEKYQITSLREAYRCKIYPKFEKGCFKKGFYNKCNIFVT